MALSITRYTEDGIFLTFAVRRDNETSVDREVDFFSKLLSNSQKDDTPLETTDAKYYKY